MLVIQLLDEVHLLPLQWINISDTPTDESICVDELHHAQLFIHHRRIDARDRRFARLSHCGKGVNDRLMRDVICTGAHGVEVVAPLRIHRRRISQVVLVLLFDIRHIAAENR